LTGKSGDLKSWEEGMDSSCENRAGTIKKNSERGAGRTREKMKFYNKKSGGDLKSHQIVGIAEHAGGKTRAKLEKPSQYLTRRNDVKTAGKALSKTKKVLKRVRRKEDPVERGAQSVVKG